MQTINETVSTVAWIWHASQSKPDSSRSAGRSTPIVFPRSQRSERSSQCAGGAYQALFGAHGLTAAMSRKGDCWDNMVAESYFAALKHELFPEADSARGTASDLRVHRDLVHSRTPILESRLRLARIL